MSIYSLRPGTLHEVLLGEVGVEEEGAEEGYHLHPLGAPEAVKYAKDLPAVPKIQTWLLKDDFSGDSNPHIKES